MCKWYSLSVEECFKNLKSSREGLSQNEAERRLKEYGENILQRGKRKTIFQIFLSQFKDILVIILIFALIVSYYLGETIDAFVIGVILLINAAIGTFQEYKSERAIEHLKKIMKRTAHVFRDGILVDIDVRELVPGDVINLEPGDIVPADSRIFEVSNLEIDESILTGESIPVVKFVDKVEANSLQDMKNMAFAGTTVTRGRAKAIVVSTGMRTELGKIAGMMQEIDVSETPLERRLNKFGKILGGVVIVISIVIFILGVMEGKNPFNMFMESLSLAVAAVPEGLPAVVAITLSLGTSRLLKKNALMRRLSSVETLGSVTVICTDKTGTLTKNEMTVKKIWCAEQIYDVPGSGYEIVKMETNDKLTLVAEICSACNNSSVRNGVVIGDPTEGALLVLAKKLGFDKKITRLKENPFDSKRKMMSTFDIVDGKKRLHVKGAPEEILDKSTKLLSNGVVELDDKKREEIKKTIDEWSSKAFRILALAYKDGDSNEDGLTFVALVGMIDPLREESKTAVKKCEEAGIRVIMITGDNPLTAGAIARELGMEDSVVTGKELDKVDDEELKEIVKKSNVYARTSPEHKFRIVNALKAQGEIVAMTGDGVNDAPSLKSADIGISMGSGTDVAKEASDMVLLDDNFSTIVSAIEEGRNIFNNIRKFVFYLLSSNAGEIAIIFLGMILRLPLPLVAIQILWINLLTDGLPALALGIDHGTDDVMKERPRDPKEDVLNKKMWIGILLIGILMGTVGILIFRAYLPNVEKARTMAFSSLAFFEFYNVFLSKMGRHSLKLKKMFNNKWLNISIIISIILQMAVIYVPFLREVFRLSVIEFKDWAIIILTSASIIPLVEIFKRIEK